MVCNYLFHLKTTFNINVIKINGGGGVKIKGGVKKWGGGLKLMGGGVKINGGLIFSYIQDQVV